MNGHNNRKNIISPSGGNITTQNQQQDTEIDDDELRSASTSSPPTPKPKHIRKKTHPYKSRDTSITNKLQNIASNKSLSNNDDQSVLSLRSNPSSRKSQFQ